MIKNTSGQHLSFIAIATADGAAVTSGTPVVYLSKDGAAQATSSNTASHLGNGVWVLDLTQAETNSDHLSAVMVLTNAVNSFAQAFPVVQDDFKAIARHYTFPDASGVNAGAITTSVTVASNLPKIQKAIVRMKLTGSLVSGGGDWLLKLNPPSGAPTGGYDLLSVKSLPQTSYTNEIYQVEVDLTPTTVPNGSWSIDWEDDGGLSNNTFSITEATIEFSDVPLSVASKEDITPLAVRRLFEFPYAQASNSVSSVATVSPMVISAKKIYIQLRYGSHVDNTPDANTHREIALQPPTPVNTSTAPAEINLKTYFGSDNRSSISNEISSAEIDITSLGLEVLHGDWTIIVRDNQTYGGNQTIHEASIEFSPLPITIGDATAASQTSISSAISALNDFDPAADTVANVTTAGSVTSAVTTSNASDVTAIKAKTDQLAFTIANKVDSNALSGNFMSDSSSLSNFGTLQGLIGSVGTDVLALNDFDPAADTVANVTTVGSVTGAVTTSNASDVTAIKAVTDNLPNSGALTSLATAASISGLNDFDPATQTVTTDAASRTASQADVSSLATAASVSALNDFDPATQTVTTDAASRTASQADVSSLATAASISALNDFDPATDVVITDAASRTASQADVSSLATTSDLAVVDSNVDAIKAKTDQMVFTNSNELDCNAVTGGGGDDAATIYSYFTASSRQDTFRADVSSLATAASVSALNDFDPATQTVTTDTASRTASQADVSSLATAASISALNDISSLDIYNYFTASNRQDTFKATGFATVNPDNTSITAIKAKTDSLTFTIANQVDANALTGGADPVGSGAISHTVTVNIDNVPANAVDVWVTTDAAGTNVVAGTLVTNQAGQATFQLDAGSYYLWCQRSGVNFTNPTAFTVS